VKLACGVAALLTVAWALLMYALLSYPLPHNFHHHIDSPVLAIELASNQDEATVVLQSNSAAIATLHLDTTLDLFFIPLYVAYLVLAARLAGARLAVILPVAIVVGLADYVEDYYIYQSLNLTTPHQSVPSLIKWALLRVALAITGVALLRNSSVIYTTAARKTLGAALLIAAALMLVAAGFGRVITFGYSPIALANIIFGLTILTNAIGLLRPYVSRLIAGTLPPVR